MMVGSGHGRGLSMQPRRHWEARRQSFISGLHQDHFGSDGFATGGDSLNKIDIAAHSATIRDATSIRDVAIAVAISTILPPPRHGGCVGLRRGTYRGKGKQCTVKLSVADARRRALLIDRLGHNHRHAACNLRQPARRLQRQAARRAR